MIEAENAQNVLSNSFSIGTATGRDSQKELKTFGVNFETEMI